MTEIFKHDAYALPVNYDQVQSEWASEGFSFGVFRDPPGQQWNDFSHATDEYVLVAKGQLQVSVGSQSSIVGEGALVRIPKHTSHSLKTLSAGGSVWLYGYGHWDQEND